MTLVSPSIPIHLRQPQVHGLRPNPSVRSTRSLVEIEEEEEGMEEKEKLYVAVGKEYKEGKETLSWVLQNISKEKKIVVVHVHRPAQMIPMLGGKFPVNQLTEEQVARHRQFERHEVNINMAKYIDLCSCAMVEADKLVIETNDVSKGLVELIAQHGITKLVMGARQYSKKLKAPKSKTAINVQQQADRSCKIWFVCRGNLISTRDAMIEGSQAAGTPRESLNSSQSYQLKSRSLPQHQTQTLDWLANATQRSSSYKFEKPAVLPLETPLVTLTSANISNPTHDEESKESLEIFPPVHEPEENLPFSTPSPEEDNVIENEVYEKLQHALKDAEDSRRKAYEESCRRRKAEIDAILAAQKIKALENSHAKELKQRRDVEITLASKRSELERLKKEYDELMEELRNTNQKKVQMEVQTAESEQMIAYFQEKLLEAKCLLNSLQQEREDAIREVEDWRRKKEETSPSMQGTMNFIEFTYGEIGRATNNFDESMKIGEGGYGSVYKGSLRNTMVAIKMLNSESMQGKAEFYQELKILTQVRHHHLVTLIGTCPEAWALIYEYLPQGSLEDRLVCKHNSPPLSWQVRAKITAEICSTLIFLHSYKPHTIVHGDLKPANILLDSKFTSKLGDFGICRLLIQSNNNNTQCKMTNPKGTFAYMDPEFISTGELTPQSDVYSFGVIILRLLTGKPALWIVKEVKDAMEGDRLHEILDVTAGDWPYLRAKQLANLGLKCCEVKRKNRPDLAKEAWKVLEAMVPGLGDSRVPSSFICPIFQEMMRDPHIASDGFTYEAEAIKGWIHSGNEKSPMTNVKLTRHDLIPNRALRSAIHEWLQKQT